MLLSSHFEHARGRVNYLWVGSNYLDIVSRLKLDYFQGVKLHKIRCYMTSWLKLWCVQEVIGNGSCEAPRLALRAATVLSVLHEISHNLRIIGGDKRTALKSRSEIIRRLSRL